MIHTTAKILKLSIYTFVIIIGVTFAVKNHGKIDLTFYPFPYIVSIPVFLFAILVFVLGLLFGWALSRLSAGRHRRAAKRAGKRIAALENELGMLRTERLVQQPAMVLPALQK